MNSMQREGFNAALEGNTVERVLMGLSLFCSKTKPQSAGRTREWLEGWSMGEAELSSSNGVSGSRINWDQLVGEPSHA